ncbi:AaceriAFR226Cp [[Ashbya] aceris (nom. inval.)]|nr:AaceriAFR226Cp [[Ashbya] aceris (nom. inval.)]
MGIHRIEDESKWKVVSASFIYSPTTAVKELLDNAIDAGASNVYIEVDSKTGGCDYISVRDDGNGVEVVDRHVMCLNHTTSKLRKYEDVSTCGTLGFRGEALFMLATLSNHCGTMEVSTRCKNERMGTRWRVDGAGEVKEGSTSSVPMPVGTSVTIRKLLHGLRARHVTISSRPRKSLDDISQLVLQYTLAFRRIRFHFYLVSLDRSEFVCQRKLQLNVDPKLSLLRVLGSQARIRKLSANLHEFGPVPVTDTMSARGVLPSMTRGSEVSQTKKTIKVVSLNRRPMSLSLSLGSAVNKMLNKTYRSYSLPDPTIWMVELECDPHLIDVNIEPTKDDAAMNSLVNLIQCLQDALEPIVIRLHRIDRVGESVSRTDDPQSTLLDDDDNDDIFEILATSERRRKLPSSCFMKQESGSDKPSEFYLNITESQQGTLEASTEAESLSRNQPEPAEEWGPTDFEDSLNSDIQPSINPISVLAYRYDEASHGDNIAFPGNISLSNPFHMSKLKSGWNTSLDSSTEGSFLDSAASQTSRSDLHSSYGNSSTTNATSEAHSPNLICNAGSKRRASGSESKRNARPTKMKATNRRPTQREERELLKLQYSGTGSPEENVSARKNKVKTTKERRRTLSMFSEYTNNFITRVQYDRNNMVLQKQSKLTYKKELTWIFRKGTPALSLIDCVQQKAEEIDNNVDLKLEQTSKGWYVVGI